MGLKVLVVGMGFGSVFCSLSKAFQKLFPAPYPPPRTCAFVCYWVCANLLLYQEDTLLLLCTHL